MPPYWGPGPQPRHVPWLGIERVTLWFTGQCSIHWATPARAPFFYFLFLCFLKVFFSYWNIMYKGKTWWIFTNWTHLFRLRNRALLGDLLSFLQVISKRFGGFKKFIYLFIYLFIFRERGRSGEREGEKCQCAISCLSHTPSWGPGPQPRHVPWLGIEPATVGSQAGTQSTEPHQPGLFGDF